MLDERIKQFRFIWDGIPLQPPVGISYCNVRSPVKHLYLLLGELNNIADMSLTSGHPENVQRRGAVHVQQGLKERVSMMNQILQALDQNRFRLMAQPLSACAAIVIMKSCCVWWASRASWLRRIIFACGARIWPGFAHRQLGYRQYAGFYER